MKQVFGKATYTANYGHNRMWTPVIGGNGAYAVSEFDETQSRTPWSCPGTFQNLTVRLPVAQAFNASWTLLKNGSATALTVTVLAGATSAQNLVDTVSVVAGDGITMQLDGTVVGSPGYDACYSIEFEGTNTGESGYGISAGSAARPIATANAFYGGALGNGESQTTHTGTLAATLSNTYSIVSTAGTLTRLDAITFDGPLGAGVWTCYLRKNGVTQDGTGGTVATGVVLSGLTTQSFSTFSLAVVPSDHVDVLMVRSGADASFALAHVACSVAFTATVDGSFILCGGNNNTTDTTNTTYMWNASRQLETSESLVEVPVGPTLFYAKGLYVERDVFPGAGKTWTHTLRVSGANSLATFVIADSATSGSIVQTVQAPAGGTLALSMVPAGTPTASQMHWALVGFVGTVALPPDVVIPVPPSDRVMPVPLRRRAMYVPQQPRVMEPM